VGHRAGLDAVAKRKIFSPYRKLNLGRPSRSQALYRLSCRGSRFSERYGLDGRGIESIKLLGIFLFTTASKQPLGAIPPPLERLRGVISVGVKRPGRGADQSPPSSADIKNALSYSSAPTIRLHGIVFG
jgi:hypothetical protein